MITNIKESNSKEELVEYLLSYLNGQLSLYQRKSESEESFTMLAWSEYQAYNLGNIRAIKKILKLFPDQGVVNE